MIIEKNYDRYISFIVDFISLLWYSHYIIYYIIFKEEIYL